MTKYILLHFIFHFRTFLYSAFYAAIRSQFPIMFKVKVADYLFPMYNIRFIALTDNIDTLNSDSASMDMLPIMNVFNEWYAANTSKKLRAVFESNAKSGKYKCTYCAFGYFKGDDANSTPIIDPYAAPIVRRMFEMRAKGYNYKKIADILNAEKIPTPSDYQYQRLGRPNPHHSSHLWGNINVKRILLNPIYLGQLAQLRTTTVSYKNHKIIHRDQSDWAIVENNHEPIITQELWDRCREVDASVSRGKRTKKGVTAPLSGMYYCDSCGSKMRFHGSGKGVLPAITCGFTQSTAVMYAPHITSSSIFSKRRCLQIFSLWHSLR